MRMLLLAACTLVSSAARGDTITVPPPRPPGPRHPPPARATVPDDLAGTWNVTMHARITSCPAPIEEHVAETWTIEYKTGAYAVRGGAMELVGPASEIKSTTFHHHLNAKQRPTDAALEISQTFKDRFSGTFVRSDPAGKRDTCVTLVDLAGLRAP